MLPSCSSPNSRRLASSLRDASISSPAAAPYPPLPFLACSDGRWFVRLARLCERIPFRREIYDRLQAAAAKPTGGSFSLLLFLKVSGPAQPDPGSTEAAAAAPQPVELVVRRGGKIHPQVAVSFLVFLVSKPSSLGDGSLGSSVLTDCGCGHEREVRIFLVFLPNL